MPFFSGAVHSFFWRFLGQGPRAEQTHSHARRRIRNPTPGKLFYCQDQVGEEPRVGLKAAGDFSLGKDVGCFVAGQEVFFFWGGP